MDLTFLTSHESHSRWDGKPIVKHCGDATWATFTRTGTGSTYRDKIGIYQDQSFSITREFEGVVPVKTLRQRVRNQFLELENPPKEVWIKEYLDQHYLYGRFLGVIPPTVLFTIGFAWYSLETNWSRGLGTIRDDRHFYNDFYDPLEKVVPRVIARAYAREMYNRVCRGFLGAPTDHGPITPREAVAVIEGIERLNSSSGTKYESPFGDIDTT